MDFFFPQEQYPKEKKKSLYSPVHTLDYRHIPSGAFISHSKYNYVCSDKL